MKKILIVDDDERIAQGLSIRLAAAGYRTFTAPDPAFAMILAAAQRPDLVITDIWMPIMQGFTLRRRLDGLGVGNLPVIYITASRKDGLRESAEQMGAAGFFEKPYDLDELLQAVHEALQPKKALNLKPQTPEKSQAPMSGFGASVEFGV